MTIESIKARLDAASESPWVEWTDCLEQGYIVVGNEDGALTEERPFTEDADFYALVCIHEDADLIAHAPTDLRALLKVAEAAADIFKDRTGQVEIAAAGMNRMNALRAALAELEGME